MGATEHVPVHRVLGIDLGGARMRTTGAVLLEGDGRPTVRAARVLPRGKNAEQAERRLLELIEDSKPDMVAIDAPLTLPPCLTCPTFCRGPSAELCELQSARAVWDAGGHPVTERLCEVSLRDRLPSGPLPTMRIAQIAARGVTLARRVLAGGTRLGPAGAVTVLEVYPYATLVCLGSSDERLKPRRSNEEHATFSGRVLDALGEHLGGLDDHSDALREEHVIDALIAAWTGWLAPDGLEQPPPEYNVAAGWIWLPAQPTT
jgi:predicted nuclease with RNAse H fold